MRDFFITGTDTGIGKTTVTSGLAAFCSLVKGLDVGVMKPFEPGLSLRGKDRLPWDAISLKEASGSEDDLALINPYAFDAAMAPGAAAEREHVQIDLEHLDMIYKTLSSKHEILFVEGAGGVLAPITRNFFFSDLMKRWNSTAVVIARLGIGTINHTLLTCRFLKDEGIPIAGVILNDVGGKADMATKTNPEVLSRYLDVPILGVFPHMQASDLSNREQLARVTGENLNMSLVAR
jgi:dethiobiotin synthetase